MTGSDRLKAERVLLGTALADVQAMLGALHRLRRRVGHRAGRACTRPASTACGCCSRWATCWSAGCCCAGPRWRWPPWTPRSGPRTQAFYQGKVAVARFFAGTVLPRLSADRAVVEAADNALMDLPSDAF